MLGTPEGTPGPCKTGPARYTGRYHCTQLGRGGYSYQHPTHTSTLPGDWRPQGNAQMPRLKEKARRAKQAFCAHMHITVTYAAGVPLARVSQVEAKAQTWNLGDLHKLQRLFVTVTTLPFPNKNDQICHYVTNTAVGLCGRAGKWPGQQYHRFCRASSTAQGTQWGLCVYLLSVGLRCPASGLGQA